MKNLSPQQHAMLKYLSTVGHCSVYQAQKNSDYTPGSCGDKGQQWAKRGMVVYFETLRAQNQWKNSAHVALPWVWEYQKRFGMWPSKRLIAKVGKSELRKLLKKIDGVAMKFVKSCPMYFLGGTCITPGTPKDRFGHDMRNQP